MSQSASSTFCLNDRGPEVLDVAFSDGVWQVRSHRVSTPVVVAVHPDCDAAIADAKGWY